MASIPTEPVAALPLGLTTEYDRFTFHPANTKISQLKVNKLVEELRKENLLTQNPIIVDDQNRIVNGQHLFLAAKSLGLAIRVVRAQPLQATGNTTSHTATGNFLQRAGVANLPGLRSGTTTTQTAEVIKRNPKAGLLKQALTRADQQANADDFLGLGNARSNLLNKAGIGTAVAGGIAEPEKPTPQDVEQSLRDQAAVTWAAMKEHFNIGDREPQNSAGLNIILNALRSAHFSK